MTRRVGPWSLVMAAVALHSSPAIAHPLDVGAIRVTPDGREVAVVLDIDHTAAAVLLKLDPAKIDAALVRAKAAELAAATFQLAPIQARGGACTWTGTTGVLDGPTVHLSDRARCPDDGERTWTFPFVREARISTGFALLVTEVRGTTEIRTLVDEKTEPLTIGRSARPPGTSWLPFAGAGLVVVVVAGVARWRRRATAI